MFWSSKRERLCDSSDLRWAKVKVDEGNGGGGGRWMLTKVLLSSWWVVKPGKAWTWKKTD